MLTTKEFSQSEGPRTDAMKQVCTQMLSNDAKEKSVDTTSSIAYGVFMAILILGMYFWTRSWAKK